MELRHQDMVLHQQVPMEAPVADTALHHLLFQLVRLHLLLNHLLLPKAQEHLRHMVEVRMAGHPGLMEEVPQQQQRLVLETWTISFQVSTVRWVTLVVYQEHQRVFVPSVNSLFLVR